MMPLTLACTGPGAMRIIQDNILYAQQHAIIVALLAVLSVTLWIIWRRFQAVPICVLLLLLIHPAWTISAIKGDCGLLKAEAATFVTILSAVCVALQVLAGTWPIFIRKAPNLRLQLPGDARDGE